MNWFGEDWGAPVCKTRRQVKTPVGKKCFRCKKKIKKRDQGIYIPAAYIWHVDCFVKCVAP